MTTCLMGPQVEFGHLTEEAKRSAGQRESVKPAIAKNSDTTRAADRVFLGLILVKRRGAALWSVLRRGRRPGFVPINPGRKRVDERDCLESRALRVFILKRF